ncbi:MAG TPA: hypothetical protein PKE30_19260 [Niabella sp.]|nr:hypothetical protein [Niabella sp.]
MTDSGLVKWLRWGLFNLAIVALYGFLMRYKIAFSFPFLEQKHLLHAHSHFAFSGWISQILYTGFAIFLWPYLPQPRQKIYKALLAFNLISSFGMLVAFSIQGYKAVSITFSTLSILIAIIYAVAFIKDSRWLPASHPSKPWAIGALLLNVLSAGGPLSLAYMMASKNIQHEFYLGSVYYYLHFQYNGWFLFGCIALVTAYMPKHFPSLKKYFILFAATVIPTFFLSILWAKLPVWLYIITVAATLVQFFCWLSLLRKLWKYYGSQFPGTFPRWIKLLFYISAIALTIKFTLQTISVIPSLSQLVFGYRPVVIAYLHLVLLAVYSLFLTGYLFCQKVIRPTKAAKLAALSFLSGIALNELLLGIQGFAAFAYIPIPYINEMLLGAAAILLFSAGWLASIQTSQAFSTKSR